MCLQVNFPGSNDTLHPRCDGLLGKIHSSHNANRKHIKMTDSINENGYMKSTENQINKK